MMNKISFLTVALLIISILLCGCENPDISESTPSTLAPTTISTPPETTVPRVPDPSEYDCFSIPDEVMTEVVPWFIGVNGDTGKIQTILKIRADKGLEDHICHDMVRPMHDPISNSNLTVEDMLQYPAKLVNSYMIIYKDGQIDFATYGDFYQYVDRHFVDQYDFWKTFYQFALFPESVLPQDTVIYDICCMRSELYSVALIGYVTDAGEFILYGNTNTGNLYLIPIETYHLIGDEIRRVEILPQNKNRDILPEDVWDLTPYKVEPKA